jgi:superfamily II DNA or RNA helicase
VRVAWIAEYCKEIAKSGNTLVLVNSIELGKSLEATLSVPFIYGGVKSSKRAEEYSGINYTDNQLLVATFGVASTGINIPRIFNLVLIEPGKSFVRVIQSIGRGLRTAADKDFVEIYDICSSAKFSKRHLTKRKEFYSDANYPFTVKKIDYR